MCLKQRTIIAKYNHFLHRFLICPSISLKDAHRSAATVHHRKVETVSPSVLDLSLNVLEGRRSISSNKSSSQSRNSFSFASPPVHQFVWRTGICLQQWIIIAKYKQFLLMFSSCPSISLKDFRLVAATDNCRKVETVSNSVINQLVILIKGLISVGRNRSSPHSRNTSYV